MITSTTPAGKKGFRIHITGASGSGTTTLGAALAAQLGWMRLDADHYYWEPTVPPYTQKRSKGERMRKLLGDLGAVRWGILTGSVCDWDAGLEDSFDLIVYLHVLAEVRLSRLRKREIERHGFVNEEFITWAALYDDGDLSVRSRLRHEHWLARRRCPILRLEEDLSVEERAARILAALASTGIDEGRTGLIRPIEFRDLSEVIDVRGATRENPFSREALRNLGITEDSTTELLRTTHRGWLCEVNGRIVGFAIGDGKTGELWVLAVLPEFEGRGIGSRLLARVETWLASVGWKEFWLWTSSDPKKRAYAFYLARGWLVSETKSDTVTMRKACLASIPSVSPSNTTVAP